MLRVGLTGGVASGKSTVARMFAELGAGIVDTDLIARDVVEPGERGLSAIVAEFGTSVLTPDGKLDRSALRRVVFADAERRKALEAILHPSIRERAVRQIAALTTPYAIVVVPLLIETGFDALVDRIAVVDCPEPQQLERLRRRDGLDEASAQAMLGAQIERDARLARADDVIDNSAGLEETRRQVETLHARYLALASEGRLPN